ncbi:MAG: hypothetical protein J6T20_09120 [Treponema sp.]|nr:hypothetical protein [Treponema sp.]
MNMIKIQYVTSNDKAFWYSLDKHLPEKEFENKVQRKQGYGMVLTSTQVDETAQHFYRKNGYTDCGSLLMNIPGFEQPMEMFLSKAL